MHENLSSITAARSEKARLHVGNPNPDPEDLRRADSNLATAKIDNRIREYVRVAGTRLDGPQTAHLVGLLLMEAGVAGSTVTLLEGMVREAVNAAQDGASA